MRRDLTLFVAVTILAVLLAGCAASSAPSESPMSSPSSTPKYPPPAGEVTVTGTVEDGVERGCVILRAGTTVYQLVGLDPAIVMGAKVTVRGRPDPGLLTTCQQGIPLHVIDVTPVS